MLARPAPHGASRRPRRMMRTAGVCIGLAALLRLAGMRDLAQLNTLVLLVVMLLSNMVQYAFIGNDDSLTGGLLGAATLVVMNSALVYAVAPFPCLSRWFEGTESGSVVGQVRERLFEVAERLPGHRIELLGEEAQIAPGRRRSRERGHGLARPTLPSQALGQPEGAGRTHRPGCPEPSRPSFVRYRHPRRGLVSVSAVLMLATTAATAETAHDTEHRLDVAHALHAARR